MDYGPSEDLKELFDKSAKVLGSMLGELNTRIKVRRRVLLSPEVAYRTLDFIGG